MLNTSPLAGPPDISSCTPLKLIACPDGSKGGYTGRCLRQRLRRTIGGAGIVQPQPVLDHRQYLRGQIAPLGKEMARPLAPARRFRSPLLTLTAGPAPEPAPEPVPLAGSPSLAVPVALRTTCTKEPMPATPMRGRAEIRLVK